MKNKPATKISFRVSGARLGDAARPTETPIDTLAMLPRMPVRMPMRPLVPVIAKAFGPDDYATAEDYE